MFHFFTSLSSAECDKVREDIVCIFHLSFGQQLDCDPVASRFILSNEPFLEQLRERIWQLVCRWNILAWIEQHVFADVTEWFLISVANRNACCRQQKVSNNLQPRGGRCLRSNRCFKVQKLPWLCPCLQLRCSELQLQANLAQLKSRCQLHRLDHFLK